MIFSRKPILLSILFGMLVLVMGMSDAPTQPEVCIGSHCFEVEIADTKQLREKGLMYVDHLPANAGMLFVFPREGKHSFWMKNTPVSLDIIWINASGRIAHIQHRARPYDITAIMPEKPGKYVLEISGGLSRKFGFKVGQTVRLPNRLFHNS